MSKSRGNVVNPDDVVHQYGADSLRLYEMFLGPLQDTKACGSSCMLTQLLCCMNPHRLSVLLHVLLKCETTAFTPLAPLGHALLSGQGSSQWEYGDHHSAHVAYKGFISQ